MTEEINHIRANDSKEGQIDLRQEEIKKLVADEVKVIRRDLDVMFEEKVHQFRYEFNQIKIDMRAEWEKTSLMVDKYSTGLMNVYQEMQQLKDKISVEKLDAKILELSDFKNKLDEFEEFYTSRRVQAVYEEISKFKETFINICKQVLGEFSDKPFEPFEPFVKRPFFGSGWDD